MAAAFSTTAVAVIDPAITNRQTAPDSLLIINRVMRGVDEKRFRLIHYPKVHNFAGFLSVGFGDQLHPVLAGGE